jgi:hypothetical protein
MAPDSNAGFTDGLIYEYKTPAMRTLIFKDLPANALASVGATRTPSFTELFLAYNQIDKNSGGNMQ